MCDPRAGVAAKTPVCARVCDSVFRACAEEHFAEDALGRVVPCRASDTICARLEDWMGEEHAAAGTARERGEGKGTQMCVAAGYDVVSEDAADGGWCFDGADACWAHMYSCVDAPSGKTCSARSSRRSTCVD